LEKIEAGSLYRWTRCR